MFSMQDSWPLALQHPCISGDAGSICRLLCVSQGMHELIHTHLHGLVAVCAGCTTMPHAVHLEAWLARHAALLRSLHVCPPRGCNLSRQEQLHAARRVAGGLEAAARRGAQLRLRELQCSGCDDALLAALPAAGSALMLLELGPCCQVSTGIVSPAPAPAGDAVADARSSSTSSREGAPTPSFLAPLPALCSLALHGEAADALLPALGGCTRLRCLRLNRLSCSLAARLSAGLPPQLRALTLVVDPDFSSWARKRPQPVLTHLTALTQLSCTGEGLFAVQAHEVLPPQLRHLTLTDCPKAQPLLALSQLQVLVLQASTMQAAELQQLPLVLPHLRDIQLAYERGNMEAIVGAAPGWPLLRGLLSSLELRVYPGPLPAETLQHMAGLGPGLTRLAISGFNVEVEVTPAQFAAALSKLQGMRELRLAHVKFACTAPPAAAAAAAAAAVSTPATPHAALVHPQRSGSSGASSSSSSGSSSSGGSSSGGSSSGGSSSGGGSESDASSSQAPAGPGDTDMLVLMRQIAALPDLQSLSLHSFPLSNGPAQALSAATRLTALQLNECDVRREDVGVLAARLARLAKLSLNWNFGLKMQRLAALSQLTGLRELAVCCGCPGYEKVLAELQENLPLLRVST